MDTKTMNKTNNNGSKKNNFIINDADDKQLPLVSVIMPIYNAEKYLKKSVRSILNEKYKNIELICVNDGSTDDSLIILNQLAKNDNRIKIINEENAGPAHARNVGLDNAKGKYVSFVDSDDFIDELTHYKLVEIAESEEADIVVFGGNPFPCSDRVPGWIWEKLSPRNIVYEGKEAGKDAVFREPSSRPFLWLHFIKKEIIDKKPILRLDESLDLGEDQVFEFMYFPRAEKIVFIDNRFYYYRWDNAGSLMWKYNHMPTSKFRKHLQIVNTVFRKWSENKYLDSNYGLVSWMVDFLYYDWKAFPKFLQIEFAKQIVDISNKWNQPLYMCDDYQLANEILELSKVEENDDLFFEDKISSLQSDIDEVENQIQSIIKSKSFRLGRLLTPKRKRLKLNSILPPQRKKN